MMKRDTAKAANAVDIHVGGRIRVRRRSLSITQESMANDLGLTFQQIQKYERGTNRVSASKLYEIARCLQVPVAYFFEGIGEGGEVPEYDPTADAAVHEFLLTPEGIELAQIFPKVRRGPMRRRILEMVRTLAEEIDLEPV